MITKTIHYLETYFWSTYTLCARTRSRASTIHRSV